MKSPKNTLALVVLAALISLPTEAATHKTTHVHTSTDTAPSYSDDYVGFLAGPGFTNVALTEAGNAKGPDSSSHTRMSFGGYYEHRFASWFAVRPEVDYVSRGYKLSEGAGAEASSSEYYGNYIEIPIQAKFQVPVGRFTPYFATGPFLGFAVSSGQTNSTGAQSQDVPNNNINTVEFGFDFGAGSSFALSRVVSFDLAFRYSLGLTNVNSLAVDGESEKLNALQILGGVAFAL